MKLPKLLSTALATAMVFGLAAFGVHSTQTSASSHREAPLISNDPIADGTDLYAFVSPDKPDTVTIITGWYPFEEPVGGPNYYMFGDDVLYEIYVDNVGDAEAHVTYQFRFKTTVGNGNTFLYNTGPVESINSANLNIKQTYSVTRIVNGQATEVAKDLAVPPVNVGAKSTPNYEALSNAGIHDMAGGGKVFAGQTDDPFFVDLNVFDLLTIRKLPGNMGGGIDGLKGYNLQTIAIQVPKSELALGGKAPTAATDPSAVIGVWTGASRQATRVLSPNGTMKSSGDYVLVSRLGAPLVNEVVVPLAAKDLWNSSYPRDDAQFLGGVTDPELARLFKAIYNIQVPPTPRDDLVAIFLTGIPGATQPPTSTLKPSEELRLNMAVPPSANPNPLGVVGGDLAGYPNGRRLADDVTDISLKAVAGAAYPLFHPDFKPDPLAAQLGDGVDANDVPFRSSFPYVAVAHDGTSSVPHGVDAPAAMQCPPAPASTPCPPIVGPGGIAPPGMPKTGTPFVIEHLGDIYGLVLGAMALVGGAVLMGGYAFRRRSAQETTKK
ncbi:MAG TPA: DUF4331 domain-containing protein [Chloroflexia bacterium]|jgi:hypothetical protein